MQKGLHFALPQSCSLRCGLCVFYFLSKPHETESWPADTPKLYWAEQTSPSPTPTKPLGRFLKPPSKCGGNPRTTVRRTPVRTCDSQSASVGHARWGCSTRSCGHQRIKLTSQRPVLRTQTTSPSPDSRPTALQSASLASGKSRCFGDLPQCTNSIERFMPKSIPWCRVWTRSLVTRPGLTFVDGPRDEGKALRCHRCEVNGLFAQYRFGITR